MHEDPANVYASSQRAQFPSASKIKHPSLSILIIVIGVEPPFPSKLDELPDVFLLFSELVLMVVVVVVVV